MDWLEEILIECPQCGESFAVQIETVVDGVVETIEDCAICCRPALLRITTTSGEVRSVEVEVT
jgi:hypothetical protein